MADPSSSTKQAFCAICKEHRPYLLALARRLTGRKDAEDLVQDTFKRALTHFAELRPDSQLKPWLSTILTRLFLDQVKRKKVAEKALPKLAAEDGLTSDPYSPQIPLEVLRDAIKRLDSDDRKMIECYIADKSYKEIADELDIPIGTVSSRMARAREHLKELLTPAGVLK